METNENKILHFEPGTVRNLLDGLGYEPQMVRVVFVTSVDLYLSPDFEPYLSPD